jgi:aminopeptidase YwaD
MRLAPDIAARVTADERLAEDFSRLCDFGGRLAGTESERRALDYVRQTAGAATGMPVGSLPVPYRGWSARSARLVLPGGKVHRCHPLVRTIATPPGGLAAEVVDLGRGTPEEFEAHAGDIRGRVVLVRHELMFSAGTIHRRRKYELARAAGAVGFLIASPLPNALVSGSSGRDGDDGIPALGITPETAALLRRTARGWPRIELTIETVEAPAETETLVVEVPGQTDEWVVLSAHVDGHDVNESAMDNASGVAAALSALRAVAPACKGLQRGIRAMFFSVEEWALTGSAVYVASLSDAEKSRIALNVNLDSVAGSANLAALTSGYAEIEPFLLSVADANGHALRTIRPLLVNSDHANFAMAGIPAFRLVAGYDDPTANLRHVLTEADTRDKVTITELKQATQLTAAILVAACSAEPEAARRWRQR